MRSFTAEIGSYIIITKTVYTTVPPKDFSTTSSIPSSSVTSSLTSVMTMTSSMLSSRVVSSSTTHPSSMPSASTSSSTPIPTALPVMKDNRVDNSLAVATLVAMSIISLFLLVLICYMIFLRIKGQCASCIDMKMQLRKWERGDLKYISAEMMQEKRLRESWIRESRLVDALNQDLEKGMMEPNPFTSPVLEAEEPKTPGLRKKTMDKIGGLVDTDAMRKRLQALNPAHKKKNTNDLHIQMDEIKSHEGDKFENVDLTTPFGFNSSRFEAPKSYFPRQHSCTSIPDPVLPSQRNTLVLETPANNPQFETSNPYHYRERSEDDSPYAEDQPTSYPPMPYSMHRGGDITLPLASVIEQAYDPVEKDKSFTEVPLYSPSNLTMEDIDLKGPAKKESK